MSYAVLRLEKVKSLVELAGRSAHNRRVFSQVLEHIDAAMASKNIITGDAVSEFRRMTEGKAMRKNGVIAVEAVMSFSHEATEKVDLEKWGADSVKWAESEFGKDNMLEVSLHMDEKTPHLHILFVPRIEGKWNWRGMCPGRAGMRALQDRYAQAMEPHNLQRGIPKIGRKHVPPAIYREIESLKKVIELKGEETKKKVMHMQNNILDHVKAYFGEEKFLQFLKWAKDRQKKAKQAAKLSEDIIKDQKDHPDDIQ